MNLTKLYYLTQQVSYKQGWELHLIESCWPGTRRYLQWSFPAPNADTGVFETQWARKWYLSALMTKGEVVQTAFAAALAAEEHECREFFTFAGKRIFGPHLTLEALVSRADMIEGRE